MAAQTKKARALRAARTARDMGAEAGELASQVRDSGLASSLREVEELLASGAAGLLRAAARPDDLWGGDEDGGVETA